MNKLSAREKGFVLPIMIIGVVVAGVIVLLVATGSLKSSNKVNDSSKTGDNVTSPEQSPQVSPVETPKPAVKFFSEPFSDSKLGFSISYPEGWKVKEDTNAATMFKPSETKGSGQADALVTVLSGSIGDYAGTKLTTLADLQKVQLKKEFSGTEFLREGAVKVGDKDAYEIEFTGSMNKEKMHAKYIIITTSSKLFAILAGSNAGLWKDNEDILNASVQTLKLQ